MAKKKVPPIDIGDEGRVALMACLVNMLWNMMYERWPCRQELPEERGFVGAICKAFGVDERRFLEYIAEESPMPPVPKRTQVSETSYSKRGVFSIAEKAIRDSVRAVRARKPSPDISVLLEGQSTHHW